MMSAHKVVTVTVSGEPKSGKTKVVQAITPVLAALENVRVEIIERVERPNDPSSATAATKRPD